MENVQEKVTERGKRDTHAESCVVFHEFGPVYDETSRVLVLGTIPSPKSREQGFYYGHPRNRFWKILSAVWEEEEPVTVEDRRAFVLRHHIALWDVLASCRIRGASDASIRDAVPNDLKQVIQAAPIRAVFCTGTRAMDLYNRYCRASVGLDGIRLPSTSPANCAVSEAKLMEAYRMIRQYTEDKSYIYGRR
ncbi:MAG: DNA-deoxyinosine glycosylase [Clostridiales bacterium]|nr:DNA-deoxyinosine glycosylase [Clostridiales bacterium]